MRILHTDSGNIIGLTKDDVAKLNQMVSNASVSDALHGSFLPGKHLLLSSSCARVFCNFFRKDKYAACGE